MRKSKFIQALEDKCRLQEELSEKNKIIAALEAQIASMKAKKHERRVSFSDLDSFVDEDAKVAPDTDITIRYISPKAHWFKRRISIDGEKIAAKAKSAKLKIMSIIRPKAAIVTPGNVSLKSVVESRHRGSWGNNLTARQKTALYDATAAFLKKHNLPVGEKLQHLQMPEALQEPFDEYLDILIGKDIFASPRDAIKVVEKEHRNPIKSGKASHSVSPLVSSRDTSSRIRNKRSANQSQDSDKKVVKKAKKKVLVKPKVIKTRLTSKSSPKSRSVKTKITESKSKSRSLFSWLNSQSLFSF